MNSIALRPPQRFLMGPGPGPVAPSVLEAQAAPTIGHLDPAFIELMDTLQGQLRQVFRTENAFHGVFLAGNGGHGGLHRQRAGAR